MAIKNDLGGIGWMEWPAKLKNRDPEALKEARERLADEIRFYHFQQFWFAKQWEKPAAGSR